jgi:phosphohistidine phosphatase
MAEGRLLYLVRHAIADEPGPQYPDDSRRPLTAEGRNRFREIAGGLVALGVELDEILTSPFVRTRQTAEILAEAWPKRPTVTDLDALAVGGRTAGVFSALASRPVTRTLALVGHMPGIGALAAELVGARGELGFKKGAVACVAIEKTPGPGAGDLLWFAPPRILRLLARR